MPCSTGENVRGETQSRGQENTRGDLFFKDEYEDQYLSPIYGAKAFPLDYPNLIDKRAGKDGSAIWIHGTNKVLKPMDSNGCIALENSNIIKLADSITLDSTPVILVEELGKTDEETRIKQEQEISRMVDQWLQSVERGSYHEYLSFYAEEYLPEIAWWMKWMKIRSPGSDFKIERDRTGIYYHDHVFVALFDYLLSKNDEKMLLGKRKLFIEKKGQAYKIIGETYQNIPKEFQSAETPLLEAALKILAPVLKPEPVMEAKPQIAANPPQEARPPKEEKSAPANRLIQETVNQWLAAWSVKDMDKYSSFYANNFYSDGMDKKKWVERKRNIAGKNAFIKVTGERIQIKQTKDTCEVVFFQDYKSSGLSTRGIKKLKLINKGGSWKIYQESWKEK
nr:L,D-transpeptidase family protein [Desulfobacula sp.]